jgi:DNA-binding transcriptional MerR regulator
MIYTVGEVAKRFNITASTLRYYDKEGLLPFLERSGSGLRMFKEEDITSLNIIECLKKTGMPIKEIKHFIEACKEGDSKINERLAIMQAQRDSVIAQMKEMQGMLDMLNYKCWYYETAKKVGTCDVHNNLDINEIPTEYRSFIERK